MPNKKQKKSLDYSLWTSPPSSWEDPFKGASEIEITDEFLLKAHLSQMNDEDKKRLKAFRVPVTPESLDWSLD